MASTTVGALLYNRQSRAFRSGYYMGSCKLLKLERVNQSIIATLKSGNDKFEQVVNENRIVSKD